MNTLQMGEKGRWAAAGAGAVVAVALVVLLFRAPLPPPMPAVAPVPKPGASVTLIKPHEATPAVNEQTILHDTMPLFLPTEYNATMRVLPRREPGKTFLDNDTLKLSFGDAGLNLVEALPPTVTLNGKTPSQAKPQDALVPGAAGQTLLGFGRMDPRVSPLPPARGGFIEVVSWTSGRKVLAESLPADKAPPTDKEWQWLEFLAAVDSAGLVGPLVLTEGSRVEEVDVYFRKFLAGNYQIGARLPPGFYRVVVAP